MLQLPRCVTYLHYFCCIANRLICCSSYDMKEKARAKVKSEDNLQGDSSFNGLQNMLFFVSSLAQVAKHQNTVLNRFGVHICTTFVATLSWRLLQTSNQWRIQTKCLGGQSNKGALTFFHLFKITVLLCDNRCVCHKKEITFLGQENGYFCWWNCAIFQGISTV